MSGIMYWTLYSEGYNWTPEDHKWKKIIAAIKVQKFL